MAPRLKETPARWDLGISDLIEETPADSDTHTTHFTTVQEKGGENVYLMRPRPSWKTSK